MTTLKIKPHIKLKCGVWKVSPVPREHNYDNRIIRMFRLAREFVNDRNRIKVILRSDAPIVDYFNVQKVIYNLHEKRDANGVLTSPPSVKVSYFCGFQIFNEWLCLEHHGLAGKRARDWWRQRHYEEPPVTTYEALRRVSELRVPSRIRVWTNKKYPEILSAEW